MMLCRVCWLWRLRAGCCWLGIRPGLCVCFCSPCCRSIRIIWRCMRMGISRSITSRLLFKVLFESIFKGLLILELLFVACAILPSIPTILIFDIKVSQIFIGLCAIWLIIFLIDDLRTIANMKKDVHQSNLSAENMPIKNLFVIGVFGYVITETTLIEPHLLTDPLYYTFLLAALTLVYTVLTSNSL